MCNRKQLNKTGKHCTHRLTDRFLVLWCRYFFQYSFSIECSWCVHEWMKTDFSVACTQRTNQRKHAQHRLVDKCMCTTTNGLSGAKWKSATTKLNCFSLFFSFSLKRKINSFQVHDKVAKLVVAMQTFGLLH